MCDCMTFPDTVEEFMEQYKMVDKEQIYSNGTEYVPIFRMRQWFEHLKSKADVADKDVGELNKFIDELEEIFADIRERHGDDSVCGLCEYDGAYIGQSGDWCNECPGFEQDDCFKLSDECRKQWIDTITNSLPSAQPETHSCDLIDRQEAIDAAYENDRYPTIKQRLEAVPSAEPQIIRCKDCKFYTPMDCRTKTGICKLLLHQNMDDDWFCAGAERRTDD